MPARHRQRQGPAGPLPQPGRPSRGSPRSGARTPRWSRRSPTARRSASSRPSWPTRPGSRSSQRGMSRGVAVRRLDHGHAARCTTSTRSRELGGIVDYTVGPPLVKVFCLAEHSDPKQRHYLNLYKMGDGPLYPFWVPYHLSTSRRPTRSRGSCCFGDGLAPPLGGPVGRGLRGRQARSQGGRGPRRLRHVHDLRRGGERRRDERAALPARGSRRGMPPAPRHRRRTRCSPTTTSSCPPGRLADRLRAEQYRHFRGETWLEERLLVAA